MRVNLLIAGVAASLAIVYLVGIAAIPRLAIGDPLGPRAFPALIGIGLLFAAGLLVFESIKAWKNSNGEEGAFPPFDRRLIAVVIATLLLTVCFEPIGYVISVGAFLLGLTMILNRGHAIANVIVSVCFTMTSAYVFNHLLGISLPAGILGI